MTRNAGSVTMSGPTRTSETESRSKLQNNWNAWAETKHTNLSEEIQDIKIHYQNINSCSNAVLRDTSLFDEGDGCLQVLSHAEVQHDAGQPPPAGVTQVN